MEILDARVIKAQRYMPSLLKNMAVHINFLLLLNLFFF
jgi:hypothetical protein